ncbi:MAG: nuclear transport factor 2 family protein [Gammaproteobacteria bacterium]|nr:nuclear transport factor 2 family protein [Gammaproteobacteria bacterium]
MTLEALEQAFATWRDALNGGDLETCYGLMAEDMVIFDEDIPWRFSKADFVDHIGFHVPLWESFQWVPRELRFQCFGATGIVSGYATFRGKPRDTGFRQRFMGFSQTWVVDDDAVLLVCWHQGPLHGQIDGASPS